MEIVDAWDSNSIVNRDVMNCMDERVLLWPFPVVQESRAID